MSKGPFYEAGWYSGDVIDAALCQPEGKNPRIEIKFLPVAQITSAYASDGVTIQQIETPTTKQYERTAYVVIKEDDERTADFAIKKLRFAGWEGTSFRDVADLRGKKIVVVCEHQQGTGTYAGRTSEMWGLPLPPRESEPMESDDKLARKLDTLFGKKLKSGSAPPPVAVNPGAAHPDMVPDDSEIPF